MNLNQRSGCFRGYNNDQRRDHHSYGNHYHQKSAGYGSYGRDNTSRDYHHRNDRDPRANDRDQRSNDRDPRDPRSRGRPPGDDHRDDR